MGSLYQLDYDKDYCFILIQDGNTKLQTCIHIVTLF